MRRPPRITASQRIVPRSVITAAHAARLALEAAHRAMGEDDGAHALCGPRDGRSGLLGLRAAIARDMQRASITSLRTPHQSLESAPRSRRAPMSKGRAMSSHAWKRCSSCSDSRHVHDAAFAKPGRRAPSADPCRATGASFRRSAASRARRARSAGTSPSCGWIARRRYTPSRKARRNAARSQRQRR